MGFETSVVIAIFFVAALILGTSVYSSMSISNAVIEEATQSNYDLRLSKLHTNLEITSITLNSTDSENNKVHMKNTGNEPLYIDRLTVLVDGELVPDYSPDNSQGWTPREKRTISEIPDGDRIKIVTHNGISAYYNIST